MAARARKRPHEGIEPPESSEDHGPSLLKPCCLQCSKRVYMIGFTDCGGPTSGSSSCERCKKDKLPCEPVPIRFIPDVNDMLRWREVPQFNMALRSGQELALGTILERQRLLNIEIEGYLKGKEDFATIKPMKAATTKTSIASLQLEESRISNKRLRILNDSLLRQNSIFEKIEAHFGVLAEATKPKRITVQAPVPSPDPMAGPDAAPASAKSLPQISASAPIPDPTASAPVPSSYRSLNDGLKKLVSDILSTRGTYETRATRLQVPTTVTAASNDQSNGATAGSGQSGRPTKRQRTKTAREES